MIKYISKIDGTVFGSKEELVKHIESTYVHEEEEIDFVYSNILSKLKEAFPDASFQLSKCNDDSYYVELTFDVENGHEIFRFTIEETANPSTYSKQFSNIETAIEFYSSYPTQTELIREALANRYNLESFGVNQWVQAGEWDEFGHHICLDVTLNGVEMYLESGISQDIETFIQEEVDVNFKNEFEGEVSQTYEGWFVGDVSLYRILNRANKVKITILD